MRPRKIKPAIIIYERLGVINMRRRPFHKKDANSPKQQLYRRRNVVMWQAYNTIKAQLPADILQRCKQKGTNMPLRLKVEFTRQCLTPNADQTDWVAEAVKISFDKFLMPYKRCFSHSPSVAMEPHCALSTARKIPRFSGQQTSSTKFKQLLDYQKLGDIRPALLRDSSEQAPSHCLSYSIRETIQYKNN